MKREEVTLLEVENGGEFLILLDGRRLRVNPGDMPTVCTWSPTAELVISEDAGGGRFPVSVRYLGIGEGIHCGWA